MPESKRQNERLVAIFVAAVLALNFPLLSIASRMKLLLGIPILYFYLFFIWGLLILVSGLAIRNRRPPSNPPESSRKER